MKRYNIDRLWWWLSFGSVVGLLASFIQTIERINFAKNPTQPLACDINAFFSCRNVFDAWQSSVFGFSNSLMCIVFFSVTLGVGLAGASGAQIGKKLRLAMHFFSVFFLGFGAWYLAQSTYVIGYICIFCLFCYAAVIGMNAAWLRLNVAVLPVGKRGQAMLGRAIDQGADLFAWILWAITIATLIYFHFWR